jgi:hypothetical protein
MATKKNSIQQERIQNVSAPPAELGAAKIRIPRRDLLTGSALLLVGSVSGCHKRPPPVVEPVGASASASSGCASNLLRTQFMADFTAKFIGDPNAIKPPGQPDLWPDPGRLWPKPTQTPNDIVTDFGTFANVLMTMGYVLAPPPAAAPGSLAAAIVQFIQTENWPTSPPVPTQYQGELPTVHLIEISVILDRLLQAINTFNPSNAPGGGGSDWPPH